MPESKTTSTKPQVSLKSLMTPSKTVTIEYPRFEGMTVDLCYLAREELVKLRKRCLLIIYILNKSHYRIQAQKI